MSAIDRQFPPIHTERLTLRAFDPSRPSDYDAVLKVYNSQYMRKAVGDVGVHTREDLDVRCRKFGLHSKSSESDAKPLPSHPVHLIYLRSTNTFIGVTSLFHRRPLPYPDIGYAIFEEYAGHGFATEAGKAAVQWWNEEMGVENIWVGTFDTNIRSQRVAKKMGLIDGGTITVMMPNNIVKAGYAFVPPSMGRRLDGVMVDVSQTSE
ncbi:uncharacterized protein Z518_06658 [Rhinocladiella mackenziei CBS 650.93]|uniref:N-acetyltransferase domain-containing protein n=1 Tax=Rhinocladiella mackenziei CBS 650.93 TaxID=1442369 RepID=A0A0D2GY23_9EURO|nr:uncharacterized protein Z518_06658 [Rhinocladiella mackenziei CBS 650.93]KIX03108.1 hypothetical protein Z518_06658 [Rhinocladiella mackenziei CBS 650.93]